MQEFAVSTLPVLEGLAKARPSILATATNLLSILGDEKLFVLIAMIVLWCFSKRGGLYMMTVGFSASTVGQTLKMLFRVPRPWNLEGADFRGADAIARDGWPDHGIGKIMNKLGTGAAGWSFPSGHTLISVGTYGAMAAWFRNKWVKLAGIALAVLVPFTRLYLGVHTILDVAAGAVIALALLLLLRPIFRSEGVMAVRLVLIGNIVLTAALLGLSYLTCPKDLSAAEATLYAQGVKDLWQLVGATVAIWAAFEVDEAGLHYPTRAIWWAQLIKIAGGAAIVLGLQLGVQKVLGYSSDNLSLENMTQMGGIACLANLVCVLGGAAIWPFTFRWFSRLGYQGKHARR